MRKAIPIFIFILIAALIGGLSACGSPTGPECKGQKGAATVADTTDVSVGGDPAPGHVDVGFDCGA